MIATPRTPQLHLWCSLEIILLLPLAVEALVVVNLLAEEEAEEKGEDAWKIGAMIG